MMDVLFINLIPFWGILAGFLAAFMFAARSNSGQSSFVHLVANGIFEVERIFSNPLFAEYTEGANYAGERLFELRSFPLSCLYAFSFCMSCIILAIFSSSKEIMDTSMMQHILIALIVCYIIVIGYVVLRGEVWVRRRRFFPSFSLTNAILDSLLRQKHVKTKHGAVKRIVEYYSMLSVRPAVSYLQAILIIVIIFASCIIYYVNLKFGNAICDEVDDVVVVICIVLSCVIPFSPFVFYTLMIRHRRNIVKEYLVYKTNAKGIEFGDRALGVVFLKGLIYSIESVGALYIAQYLTLAGVMFAASHMIYYFMVIFAVHIIYLYVIHRNKVNTIGPEREIDEWIDLNEHSNVLWTAVRDSVCVCVLIPFDIRLNEFWLGIIIFFSILVITRVIVNNILFNKLKEFESAKKILKWLGVIPRTYSYQNGCGVFFEKDEERVEAVFLWDQFYAKDRCLISFKDMALKGYELKRSDITGYYFVKDAIAEQAIMFGDGFYALKDFNFSYEEMTRKGYKLIVR